MLKALGVRRLALLSNNPDKVGQLRSCGLNVVEQVPTGVYVSAANHRYLETKARRGRLTLELSSLLPLQQQPPGQTGRRCLPVGVNAKEVSCQSDPRAA